MHPEKLQAIILSSSDYGERDRIVSLFTLEHGRLKGFARGARNSRKRFGPALESFARIDVQLVRKDGLSSLRSADVISLYTGIRSDLQNITVALYACELIESLTPEGHPLPRLYRLLAAYLDRLDSHPTLDADRRFFEINALNILGYRPSLEECSRCGSAFVGSWVLLQQGGEPVCRQCAATGATISVSALQSLRTCLATSRFGLVSFSEDDLVSAALLLDEAITAHVGRKLKSLDFLNQLHQ